MLVVARTLAILSAIAASSCASRMPAVVTPSYPPATSAAAPTPIASSAIGSTAPTAASAAAPSHVFIIVMENKSASESLSQPYTASLARQYSSLSHYQAVAHPSAPNYLALASGSTWGRWDDAYVTLPAQDIGHQLNAARISWRAYMESMPADCLQNTALYAVKHNPFAYFGGACPANVVPLTNLESDLAGAIPSFIWITPNLCNDTHNCSLAAGDRWLASTVTHITASTAWRAGGVLFITWDEDDGSAANHVATLVVSPTLRAVHPDSAYTHYSLLATMEDRLGLPRLPVVAGVVTIQLCC